VRTVCVMLYVGCCLWAGMIDHVVCVLCTMHYCGDVCLMLCGGCYAWAFSCVLCDV